MDVHDIHVTGKGAIPPDAGLGSPGADGAAVGGGAHSPTSLVSALNDAAGDADAAKPLIAFRVETKPLTEKVDAILNVEMQSLQVTFDINTVEAAIAFVKPLEVRRQLFCA